MRLAAASSSRLRADPTLEKSASTLQARNSASLARLATVTEAERLHGQAQNIVETQPDLVLLALSELSPFALPQQYFFAFQHQVGQLGEEHRRALVRLEVGLHGLDRDRFNRCELFGDRLGQDVMLFAEVAVQGGPVRPTAEATSSMLTLW